ncbi:hypothetical protein MOV66_10180 [Agrobacterium sp. SHOUNA12C]|nr:hypothetical protein [Agrobacterium sp. BETTINA12B]MCJ9757010.1 hypothetical protein [Agrobacterium sp. SHOUNA12C]
MDRINGSGTIDIGSGRRGFRDENLGTGIEGTEVTALFLNMIQEEISKVIESAGIVLDPADWAQLAKAIQSKRMNYAIAGGTAVALTATLAPALASYPDGILVEITPQVAPAAGATLALNGLAAKAIKGPDGRVIRLGDMGTSPALLAYRASTDCFVLLTPPRIASQILGFKAQGYIGGALASTVETQPIIGGAVIFDTDGAYNAATGEYTVPRAGIYTCTANFYFESVAYNTYLFIRKNGVRAAENSANTAGRVLAVSTSVPCVVGDKLALSVIQNSPSSMTLNSTIVALQYPHAFSAVYAGSI